MILYFGPYVRLCSKCRERNANLSHRESLRGGGLTTQQRVCEMDILTLLD
jgi:hypothetical protein